MHLNVHFEDPLASQITRCAKDMKKPTNLLVREAVEEWIVHHKVKAWPKSIREFKGIKRTHSFESYRRELSSPKTDPLA